MILEFELSKLALKDIDSIWQYTAKQWSVKQANQYYQQIFKEINLICKSPKSGKSIKEIKEHHRVLLVKSHLIVYKIEKNKILIDRILHQKMDIQNHLNE